MSQLLDRPYTRTQMTYDLRRLRLLGLIQRLPKSNTYVLTPDGNASPSPTPNSRLLPPLLATDQPPAPPPLRWRTIEHHVSNYLDQARLTPAA